jgi:hypothetical protein
MTFHSERRMISLQSVVSASRAMPASSLCASGPIDSASLRGRFVILATLEEPTQTEVESALALAREVYEAMLAKLPPELRP